MLYRTSELFLKLFGLLRAADLPDIAGFDPSPEFEQELRDRLLRAGGARAGLAGVAHERPTDGRVALGWPALPVRR